MKKLIHVNLDEFKEPHPMKIDWDSVSYELKAYIAWEYKRGYFDAQRRLCEDLKNYKLNSVCKLRNSVFRMVRSNPGGINMSDLLSQIKEHGDIDPKTRVLNAMKKGKINLLSGKVVINTIKT